MSYANGPKIVTDGLVLCLDAANRKSYPLSGSTIYDLSGNENNGTIKNSTTFTNTNGGELNFDAADEEVWVSADGVNTNAGGYNTVEFWMKWNGNNAAFPMEFSTYRLYIASSNFGFNTGSGDLYGVSFTSTSWKHVVAVFYNGNYLNNNLLYLDSVNQSLSQKQNPINLSNAIASSQVTIAGNRGSNNYGWYGKMGLFRIYNRALSSDEIRQNYNALKGRYGLT